MKQINKILFITPSNIGDVILTLPSLDYLQNAFPASKITVIAAPRAQEIFKNNPMIDEVIVYDKYGRMREKIRLFFELKKRGFDIVADFRNSLFGALLPAQYRTSPFLRIPRSITHMKDRNLYRVRSMMFTPLEKSAQTIREQSSLTGSDKSKPGERLAPKFFYISPQEEDCVDLVLKTAGMNKGEKYFVVSAGGRSHTKRWMETGFAELSAECVKRFSVKIVLVGHKTEAGITGNIVEKIPEYAKRSVLDLTGKTSIAQLGCLLKRAELFITNDSGNMHLAGYLNIPTVALFGLTSDVRYGPWSEQKAVVKKEIFCQPCLKAQCRYGTLECLRLIKVEDVLRGINAVLKKKDPGHRSGKPKNAFKRILISRTDRMGDVILSTPVIKAVREAYPHAYIAMMVSPYTKDIVGGNPYLDEVIIYDKNGCHKGLVGSLKFAGLLRKRRFDVAFILHPTNRAHLVTFLAGIPRRIGYNRKLGFLLTDRIPHLKQLGQKHEKEYNLDIIRYAGIQAGDAELYVPIKAESELWAKEFLKKQGIGAYDKILAIHPSASCISRRWPFRRFAAVADRLAKKYSFKIVVVAGAKDTKLARDLISSMHSPGLNLAGKTTVSQLASVLKRCRLFISNDSGPAHLASAVGVPVISIFGRNQKGLSPQRWMPLGKHCRFLHKDIGCTECLAHNCNKNFACLTAITVDEVVRVAEELLGSGLDI